MSVKFSSYFQPKVESTACRMVEEALDVCEIPDGLGMVLVRVKSDEYLRRLSVDSRVIIFPKIIKIDEQDFIVCEC